MNQGIWATVSMKDTRRSKQRLATALDPDQRRLLALTMFEDVLLALHGATSLAGIAVVTIDAEVAAIARRFGAMVIADDAQEGQTAAVLGASRVLRDGGCAGMLALPGDIPGVTPDEIELLLAAHDPAPSFTIAPSHDELGSNAVLASPPGVVRLQFGDASYRPHVLAAQRAGIRCRSVHLPNIALDLDHPADIKAFLTRPSNSLTRRFLQTIFPS